ncbi:hypothetical protein ABID20_002410 [Rhizobium alvei]
MIVIVSIFAGELFFGIVPNKSLVYTGHILGNSLGSDECG